ncbi:MAG: ATP-binding protein [Caldilineaceae bacterium]
MARLIIVGGFAGAGKSTLARRLGNTFSMPVYEIDALARSVQSSKDFHGASHEAYGISFDLFFSLALIHLQNNCSLILDQNMGREQTWKNVEKLRTSLPGVEITILLLDCPYELCLSRVATRTDHPNQVEVTTEVLHSHKWKWDYLNENEFPEAIRVDATQSQEAVFAEVCTHLTPR